MKCFIFLAILFILSSCSHIQYVSKGTIAVHYSSARPIKMTKTVQTSAQFFFWGRYPKNHFVILDDIAKKAGFKEVNRIKIRESTSFSDLSFALLTLGTYLPRTIELEFYGSD